MRRGKENSELEDECRKRRYELRNQFMLQWRDEHQLGERVNESKQRRT